jgi:hypothetical protein
MRQLNRLGLGVLVLVAFSGCATSKVTARESEIGDERIARPDRIYVYDFAATAADMPADVAASSEVAEPSTPPSPEEIEAGRKLGELVASSLASKIDAMGLPAVHAGPLSKPQVGDIVIHGHFGSIEEGSAGKRLVLGFGSGNAELKTAVAAYQVTASGLRKLGSGAIDSGGGKSPGLLVPLAVTVATANPIGLVVVGAAKAGSEISGRNKIEASAERTAAQIATEFEVAFKKQGWI